MSKQQKLIARLCARSKDFTWDELESFMKSYGYTVINGRGSRRRFYNKATGRAVAIHEPHPQNTLKAYQVEDILEHLAEAKLI